MPAVVSDSSPLIYLTRLGRLEWLRVIYGSIIIPEAVWSEIIVGGKAFPEAVAVQSAVAQGWMNVQSIEGEPPLAQSSELDPGETEAILLARKLKAILVIDESAGRAVARELGIEITGTAGVLLRAKLQGLTKSLRNELDCLERETTFWLADDVRNELLREASEQENQ